MPKFPDRWFDYSSVGEVIQGTRIITFKVPLKETFFHGGKKIPNEDRFTPDILLKEVKSRGLSLGLVIDLTFTDRYYSPEEFTSKGVQHEKIFVPGHVIPEQDILDKFYAAIDKFLECSDKDSMIGVHCTHGVNRTGYIVCRYMVEHLGMKATEALEAYRKARGYPVERLNYINDLKMRAGEEYDKEALNTVDRFEKGHGRRKGSQHNPDKRHSPPRPARPSRYNYHEGFDWFDNPPEMLPSPVHVNECPDFSRGGNSYHNRGQGYSQLRWGQGCLQNWQGQDDSSCIPGRRQWNRNLNNSGYGGNWNVYESRREHFSRWTNRDGNKWRVSETHIHSGEPRFQYDDRFCDTDSRKRPQSDRPYFCQRSHPYSRQSVY